MQERNPTTPEETARYMSLYEECHSMDNHRPTQDRKSLVKEHSYSSKFNGKPTVKKESEGAHNRPDYLSNVTCYKCNKKGHIAKNCRAETFKLMEAQFIDSPVDYMGSVEESALVRMKIDTGCDRTCVRKCLVPKECLLGKYVTQRTAYGKERVNQLAKVKLNIDGLEYQREVSVTDKLAAPVLLGRDLPLYQLIWRKLPKEERDKWNSDEQVLAVETRAYKKQRLELEVQQKQEEQRDGGIVIPLAKTLSASAPELNTTEIDSQQEESSVEDSGEDGVEIQERNSIETPTPRSQKYLDHKEEPGVADDFQGFADDLFGESRSKQYLSRSQKREKGAQRVRQLASKQSTFQQLQLEDQEIQEWKQKEEPDRVIEKNGIMLRSWKPRSKSMNN